MDPKLIANLAKFGISAAELAVDAIKQIDCILQEKYAFHRPRKFPRLAFSTFRERRTKTIDGRQYVLEQGMFRGRFWRIRERSHPFVTTYFVWDEYQADSDAVAHWESFVGLLEARSALARSTSATT